MPNGCEMAGRKDRVPIGRRLRALASYASDGVWAEDVERLGFLARLRVQCIRFMAKTLGGFAGRRCGLHAAGLTYYSLLSLVPVLCLLLLLARTCGVGDFARGRVNASIDSFITEVEKGQDDLPQFLCQGQSPEELKQKRAAARDFALQARGMANELFDRVARFDVGTLGVVGVAMLLWTVVSSLGMVEVAFNELWGVRRARPVWRRLVLYAFVAVVLPLLASLAMSMPVLRLVCRVVEATLGAAAYTRWAGDAIVALLKSRLFATAVTLSFASLAFAFVFWFMPHRRVPFAAAFKAGVATALLAGGWMKLCVVAQIGIAQSSALYGSFAFLPIVLAWLYMSWQIVLLGGSMSYAFACVHSRVRDLPAR